MTTITAAWLHDRGLLHDARVLAAKLDGASIRITIDDEWANEHDVHDGRFAGVLAFDDATVLQGDVGVIEDAWISEVEYRGGNLVFDFCDRDRLIIRASTATWKPEVL